MLRGGIQLECDLAVLPYGRPRPPLQGSPASGAETGVPLSVPSGLPQTINRVTLQREEHGSREATWKVENERGERTQALLAL